MPTRRCRLLCPQLLGLMPGASKADIKAAYKKLAIKWHPDKHMGKPTFDEANKKFAEITRAFDSLMSTDEEDKVEQIGN